jgi:septum formation protein
MFAHRGRRRETIREAGRKDSMPPLFLASGSPRRRQFLLELGLDFRVVPTRAAEERAPGEEPLAYALRLARDKAAGAAGDIPPGAVVLGADTIVVVGDEVLEKPADEADFGRMMRLLSGRTHEVITGVAAKVVRGATLEASARTRVTFRPLSDAEIAWYWQSGEPKDKAGGYAIQHRGGAFVSRIEGSHSNVIGLPLVETLALLEEAGVKPPWHDPRVRS